MKTLTRFLETELSGKYILNFYRSLDITISQSLDWSGYLYNLTLDNIQRSELEDLCRLFRAYNPTIEITGYPTSLTLTNEGTSKLKNITTLKWEDSGYTEGEINDLATNQNRTGLVEEGATIQGYISQDTQAYDEYGNVKPEAIEGTPPTNKAYSDYYGDKYLYLSSQSFVMALLSDQELKDYLYVMNLKPSWYAFQKVAEFLNLSETLTLELVENPTYYWQIFINYTAKTGSQDLNKIISLFTYIITNRFNLIHLEDIT